MKRILKISAMLLLAAYLVVTLFVWSDSDKSVVCGNFYIEIIDNGNEPLVTSEDVYNYLKQHEMLPTGKPIGDIDLLAIERSVASITLLTDVDCYYNNKGDVYLTAVQRKPVMRIFASDGDSYYIDAQGVRIDVNTMYNDYLPLVMGHVDDNFSASELIPFVNYIAGDSLWSVQIDQIKVTPEHEIILYPRLGNHVIALGDLENYEAKLNNVAALYDQVMPQVGWAAYDTISVKYENQVVCTRCDKKYRHKMYDKETKTVI